MNNTIKNLYFYTKYNFNAYINNIWSDSFVHSPKLYIYMFFNKILSVKATQHIILLIYHGK
jgi:hypothetical protein